MVSKSLQKQGLNKQTSEFIAVVFVAGTYGFFSAPLNQLRFKKQLDLTKATQNKSYYAHSLAVWNQEANASQLKRIAGFFKAAPQRAITTTIGGAFLVKGAELYDKLFPK